MNENPRLPGDVIYEGGGYDLSLAKQSVGPGWHHILEKVFDAKPEWIKIVQIKEKFGGLRCYLDAGTVRVDCISADSLSSFALPTGRIEFNEDQAAQLNAFQKMVWDAEAESFTVCEDCGATGSRRPGGWIRTLCDQCHRNRKSEDEP